MGFEELPCFEIVCVVFVPNFTVMGKGSGKYSTSVFVIVADSELPAPNVAFAKPAIAVPTLLKKLPISFQNVPLWSARLTGLFPQYANILQLRKLPAFVVAYASALMNRQMAGS